MAQERFACGQPPHVQTMLSLQRARLGALVRRPAFWACWLLTAIAAVHLATIRFGHQWGDDFALYLLQAKNIAEGRPYDETGFIYNPAAPGVAQARSPVFPLLLAPTYAWFGLDLNAMKIEIVLLFTAALGVLFLAFRRQLSPVAALGLVAVVGLNPYFSHVKEEILSDIPFLLIAALALWLAGRDRPAARASWHTLYALAVGVVMLVAYGTRSIGVTLIASLVVAEVWRFRRPTRFLWWALLPFACYVAVMLASPGPSWARESIYAHQFAMTTPQTVLRNAQGYATDLAAWWSAGPPAGWHRTLTLVLAGCAWLGFGLRLTQGPTIYEVFTVVYSAALLGWPRHEGSRLLIPLFPFVVFYAWVGLRWLAHRRRWLWLRCCYPLALLLVGIGYVLRYATMDYGPLPHRLERPEPLNLFAYIKQRTPPDAVCISVKPRALALFTGRRAAMYNEAAHDDQTLLAEFDALEVDYVVISLSAESDHEFLYPFITRHPDRFQVVYANDEFLVHRMTSETRQPRPAVSP